MSGYLIESSSTSVPKPCPILLARRDKDKILALAKGHQLATPADVLKDPFVLEFLGLDEKSAWRERELEQAIIDRIEGFLLELGKGFCCVARQKRVTLEGDHFYVDLVFYNRLLRCFVLVDLKLGKLTHQIFNGAESMTPGVVSAAARAPRPPQDDAETGPLVSFARSGGGAHWPQGDVVIDL